MGNLYTKEAQEPVDHIVYPKFTKLDTSIPSPKKEDAKKQIIDKEHITISKIFKISLEESDKFLYLEFYLAQLLNLLDILVIHS